MMKMDTDFERLLLPPKTSKEYLTHLKQLLNAVKSEEHKESHISSLVCVYLDCPSRIPAQRILASFFQNLDGNSQNVVETVLCKTLEERLTSIDLTKDGSVGISRHCVDTLAALMENFRLGEKCLASIAITVVHFLSQAGEFFLSHVQKDGPPVKLNEVMHHCHSTMQTLNLILQKVVGGEKELTKRIVQDTKLMAQIFKLDLNILKNEIFLLDCRCNCAINAILLVQMSVGTEEAKVKVPMLLCPSFDTGRRSCGTLVDVPGLKEDLVAQFNLEHQSTLSYLALAWGYLAVVPPSNLMLEQPRADCFYVDVLLPQLLHHGIKCTNAVSKALYGKTVCLCTSKMLGAIQDAEKSHNTTVRLQGDSPALQSLLGYVWTHWEDQIDVIRQNAKSVFENVLKIHSLVANVKLGEPDDFIQSILRHLFAVGWTSQGKASTLASCVRLVGTQAMLAMRPELPSEVIHQMEDQGLSCYISELYSTMLTTHLMELSSSEHPVAQHSIGDVPQKARDAREKLSDNSDKVAVATLNSLSDSNRSSFLQTWAEPVTRAMSSNNKRLRRNIVEYLLPKLLRTGDQILNYMVEKLSISNPELETRGANSESCYGAIIMCMRRARVIGLLKPAVGDSLSEGLWYGQLHVDRLRSALCCRDDQIRLDALALVAENHKTTETISAFEFDMLKFFIPYNMNNQQPSFRQALVALLKKFFFRVKESLGALRRNSKKSMEKSPVVMLLLQNYKVFLTWLTHYTLNSLYPGSAFARRTTCLAIASLLATYFETAEKDGFSFTDQLLSQHVSTLLDCLTDTFEENKQQAMHILTSYLSHQGGIWEGKQVEHVIKLSLTLACSTRPQDCSTAVYILILVLRQQLLYPSEYIIHIYKSVSHMWIYPPSEAASLVTKPLLMLPLLLSLLDDQIAVADHSLISAAAQRPMYPTLHCIRYVMKQLDFGKFTPEDIPATKQFITCLIDSCLNISRVVSPVVKNSSPEGNIPEGLVLAGDGPHPLEEESVALSQAMVESMPEYLVVCCWRSVKEVSLTLGQMCSLLPVALIKECEDSSSLLSFNQVETIGEHFTEQLLESVHRGAFELAYAGFQLLCQMLWSHPASIFHQLPARWLSKMMADVTINNPNSRLCVTRRSAGLPFFVQAIISSEPSATGRKCFHGIMKELLTLSKTPAEGKADVGNAQVHALNVLRALYRDARLGEDVLPYVADGLQSAVLGFKSDQWAVRNCSTLLLSALMTRIFGVKRSKDEAAMSKKNCQTGRLFFHCYPSLYPFLLSELKEATDNISSRNAMHLHPGLYPVLLVLGRLFPSTLEGSDTSLSLSDFIPYVIKCAACPVYKTRVIAARALRPLAMHEQVISIGQKLFNNLLELQDKEDLSSCHIHGSLLQLCELMQVISGLASTHKEKVLEVFLPMMLQCSRITSSENPCFATRQAAFLLTDMLMDIAESLASKSEDAEKLRRQFIVSISISQSCDSSSLWKPWFHEFERTRARLCLKHVLMQTDRHVDVPSLCDQDKDISFAEPTFSLIQNLLDSPLYEVRLEVLHMFLTSLGCTSGTGNSSDVEFQEHSEFECMKSSDNVSDLQFTEEGSISLKHKRMQNVAASLFEQLLCMAVDTETHPQCQEKIFFLLSSLPETPQFLHKKAGSEIFQIFSSLVEKIKEERRTEVKAAMMQFSGCLIPLICDSHSLQMNMESRETDAIWKSLKNWTYELTASCEVDESADLQIACSHVLLNNVDTLLLDSKNKIGQLKYSYWHCVAVLLQDDDLEVKEQAVSIVCAVDRLTSESYHPNYGLHHLPQSLVRSHAANDLSGVIYCLMRWILNDSGLDIKNSDERLFDKGEMNTYKDQVAFSRSVAATLASLFGIELKGKHSCLHNLSTITPQSGHSTAVELTQCVTEPKFTGVLTESFSKVAQDVKFFMGKCEISDRFLNHSRYLSLYQTIFKAQLLLFLFDNIVNSITEVKVKYTFRELREIVENVSRMYQMH